MACCFTFGPSGFLVRYKHTFSQGATEQPSLLGFQDSLFGPQGRKKLSCLGFGLKVLALDFVCRDEGRLLKSDAC